MMRREAGAVTAIPRTVFMLLAMLTAALARAAAQQSVAPAYAVQGDVAEAEIRSTLRSFYFSLAHRDWEALSANILPAKVVAHHPAPEAIVAASTRPVGAVRLAGSAPARNPIACASATSVAVDDAVVMLRDDWAEVSVARCGTAVAAGDEFRFIRFEGRWWIVFIDLFREPA
jgi:hypothetical protein